jgi:hypothetical protein
MGFFKDLKNRVRSQTFTMAEQPRSLPLMMPRSGFNPFRDPLREERKPRATTVNPGIQSVRDLVIENINTGALPPEGMSMPTAPNEAGLMPLPRPRNKFKPRNKFMPGRFPRRLPQIIPERMPSRRPTPRFFGGGLRSIFAGLPQFMERFEDQRGRQGMSPPLPRAPLPIPQDMPRERFPIMRPRFAEGEDVDINEILETQSLRDEMLNTKSGFFEFEEPFNTRNISDTNMLIAEQGAREGISPAEMATQRIKQFLADSGRTVSNRDAELYGMGMLTLEDIMQRAEPVTNRNLMQQEQMFFPESKPTDQRLNRMLSAGRGTASSLDDILEDLEKKN